MLSLVPKDATELVELANESVDKARSIGAPVRPQDVSKSVVHTWLAWQRDPGLQLHIAVKQRVLDPSHPKSALFISWFDQLFGT